MDMSKYAILFKVTFLRRRKKKKENKNEKYSKVFWFKRSNSFNASHCLVTDRRKIQQIVHIILDYSFSCGTTKIKPATLNAVCYFG